MTRHIRKQLAPYVGRRVRCLLDDPKGEFEGTLVELRPSGPRVHFDGPPFRERTVAAWRIFPAEKS